MDLIIGGIYFFLFCLQIAGAISREGVGRLYAAVNGYCSFYRDYCHNCYNLLGAPNLVILIKITNLFYN